LLGQIVQWDLGHLPSRGQVQVLLKREVQYLEVAVREPGMVFEIPVLLFAVPQAYLLESFPQLPLISHQLSDQQFFEKVPTPLLGRSVDNETIEIVPDRALVQSPSILSLYHPS